MSPREPDGFAPLAESLRPETPTATITVFDWNAVKITRPACPRVGPTIVPSREPRIKPRIIRRLK